MELLIFMYANNIIVVYFKELLSFRLENMFFNLSTIVILGQIIVVGCSLVHCRMFSSLPVLYALGRQKHLLPPIHTDTQVVTINNVSRDSQMSPWGQSYPGLRSTALKFREILGQFTGIFIGEMISCLGLASN